MRPEPAHRPVKPRKRYREAPPLSLRIGAIQDELDARSDGTHSGYRAVIMESLKRYFMLLSLETPCIHPDTARALFEGEAIPGSTDPLRTVRLRDALERAHILVKHAGLSVDAALVAVGLVKEDATSQ